MYFLPFVAAYSILIAWSGEVLAQSIQREVPRYRLSERELHVYSGFRYRLPPIPVQDDTYRRNAEHIVRMTETDSAWHALQHFRDLVAPGQPWDYKTKAKFSEAYEEAGNFNYGATGYIALDQIASRAGISKDMADMVIRWALRAGGDSLIQSVLKLGGGVVQVQSNWKRGKPVFGPDSTWYGEEKKDVAPIDAGIAYGRYLTFERTARSVGVRLKESDFGFERGFEKSRYRLLSEDFESDLIRRESEQDYDLDRWKEHSLLLGGSN